jgi:hypothetical protein
VHPRWERRGGTSFSRNPFARFILFPWKICFKGSGVALFAYALQYEKMHYWNKITSMIVEYFEEEQSALVQLMLYFNSFIPGHDS